jgi:hypothetical protein
MVNKDEMTDCANRRRSLGHDFLYQSTALYHDWTHDGRLAVAAGLENQAVPDYRGFGETLFRSEP